MSQQDVLGSALAEVAGPLKDFLEKLSSREGREWSKAFKRFLRKENSWHETITLSVNYGLDDTSDTYEDRILSLLPEGTGYCLTNRDTSHTGKHVVDVILFKRRQLTGEEREFAVTTEEVLEQMERVGLEPVDNMTFLTLLKYYEEQGEERMFAKLYHENDNTALAAHFRNRNWEFEGVSQRRNLVDFRGSTDCEYWSSHKWFFPARRKVRQP